MALPQTALDGLAPTVSEANASAPPARVTAVPLTRNSSLLFDASCGLSGEQKDGGGDRRRENLVSRVITAAPIGYVPTGAPGGPPRRRPIATQTTTIRLARRAKPSDAASPPIKAVPMPQPCMTMSDMTRLSLPLPVGAQGEHPIDLSRHGRDIAAVTDRSIKREHKLRAPVGCLAVGEWYRRQSMGEHADSVLLDL